MAVLILEVLIAFLCVIGVIGLIRSVYDQIYTEEAEKEFSLCLTFQGDGKMENLEYMLKKAKYLQKTYYPAMQIILKDTAEDEYAEKKQVQRLCEELQIQYDGDMTDGRKEMDMYQRRNGSGGVSQ